MNATGTMAGGNGARAVELEPEMDQEDWQKEYWRLVALERQLEASRATYAALYESAPVGYATLDPNGCIRAINATGARILERQPERLIGGTLFALVTRVDQRKFLAHLAQVRKCLGSSTAEVHFRLPGGGQALLQLIAEAAPAGPVADHPSSPGEIRMVFSDVTNRRQTELELNESRAELAALTASARDAMILLTENQQIVHFNAAAEEMFGCSARQAVGKPIAQFIASHSQARHEKVLRHFAQGRVTFARMGFANGAWGRRADGREFPIESSLSQFEVNGQRRLTLILRDVTARVRAEAEIRRLNTELEQRVRDRTARLEAANRDLQREVVNRRQLQHQLLQIAEREQRRIGRDLHDGIGQQLTGLMLLNDALLRRLGRVCPAEAAESLRMRRLLAETHVQLRQLARGLQPVAAVSSGLMGALGQLTQTIAALHRIDCRFQCSQTVLVEDNLVATHLFRIAQEAIHNAVRHSHCSKIIVTLTSRRGALTLTVKDNGSGLAAAPSGSRGLGLLIMRSRSEAIGGSLNIAPARPQGTRLVCRVPSRLGSDAASSAPKLPLGPNARDDARQRDQRARTVAPSEKKSVVNSYGTQVSTTHPTSA